MTTKKPNTPTAGLREDSPSDVRTCIYLMAQFDGVDLEEAQLRIFLRACVWFYGNLSLKTAYELYTRDYGIEMSRKDFTAFVKNTRNGSFESSHYEITPLSQLYSDAPADTFWNQEIIHPELFKRENRQLLYYKISDDKRAYNKPLCVLPWRQFIAYWDGDRAIDIGSKECKRAFKFFQGLNFSTDKKIKSFLGRLVYNSRIGKNFLTFLKKDPFYKALISAKGDDLDTCNEALRYIQDIINNTSTMANNGYSPHELARLLSKNPQQPSQGGGPKVVFSERMTKEIRQGSIDEILFAHIIATYPAEAHQSAWEEYWRIRNDKTR